MDFKTCPQCGVLKNYAEFNKDYSRKDGLQCYCKECLSSYRKSHKAERKNYLLENIEKINRQAKEYRTKHRDKRKVQKAEWDAKNKDHVREYFTTYREKNKDKFKEYYRSYNSAYYKKNTDNIKKKVNEYYQKNKRDVIIRALKRKKERLKTDERFRLNRNISSAIQRSLKGSKSGAHWENLVGYTVEELIKHLKNTIPDGFT
jgi:hypothetical protein